MYFYKVAIKKGIATLTSIGLNDIKTFRCIDIAKIYADEVTYGPFPFGFERNTHEAYRLCFEFKHPIKHVETAKIITQGDEHLEIMESLIRGDDYPKKPVELA